jgi:nucleoid-associated protein YgaU
MSEVAVAGGDLFRIAASLLGDPLLWTEIAQANAIEDVLVQGVTVLQVPDAPSKG